ncbi:MAG: hypothetical protein HYW48_00280 [Deltaproteobacteria bacterium]|nr:hypothetical protein [Deltaproteobacteria bacterium]
MELLISLTVIGLVATSAMNTFMWILSGLTHARVDMVNAVGSLYTHSIENSFWPGLIMQFSAGVIMTYVYGIFLGLGNFDATYTYAFLGLFMGLIHGTAVAVIMAKLLGEHHPVASFQKVTGKIALAHVVGHLIFGLVIGTMYGMYLVS